MTEEPFRWLEAMSNRREYVAEQLKPGTPAFGVSLAGGILLMGVGSGHSKVFELFDRQAMAALGHPADIERIRQSLIDAAHMEGFARAPEDVSLRRLVGFGLGPQMKSSFEQVYSAPFLAEILLGELGPTPESDLFVRLHFDGAFEVSTGGVHVVSSAAASETGARQWLKEQLKPDTSIQDSAELLMQAWWLTGLANGFPVAVPSQEERRSGWRTATATKTIELAWLDRNVQRAARYRAMTPLDVGLR